MNFSTALALIALVVSVLSALASAASALSAYHTARAARDQAAATRDQAEATKKQLILDQDRRTHELAQKRQEEAAAALANMRVLIQGHPSVPRIAVENAGPHAASKVALTYLDADDGSGAPDTGEWNQLAATLPAGERDSVAAGFTVNSTRRFRVTLRWEDGTGNHSDVRRLEWDPLLNS